MTSGSLFCQIPRVAVLSETGKEFDSGSSLPTLVTDEHGRSWVRKRRSRSSPEVIFAEVVGALLGQSLECPAPDAAFHDDGFDVSFLSEYQTLGMRWNSGSASNLSNYDELAASLVLDIILMNPDREPYNVLLQQSAEIEKFEVWTIDMGAAQVSSCDFLACGLEHCHPGGFYRAYPIAERIIDGGHLFSVYCRCSDLKAHEVRAVISDACGVSGLQRNVQDLAGVLYNRLQNAEGIVSRFLCEVVS